MFLYTDHPGRKTEEEKEAFKKHFIQQNWQQLLECLWIRFLSRKDKKEKEKGEEKKEEEQEERNRQSFWPCSTFKVHERTKTEGRGTEKLRDRQEDQT